MRKPKRPLSHFGKIKMEKQFTLTELDAASDDGYFEAIKHNIMSTPALVFETEEGEQKLVGDITREQIRIRKL